jgi:DNA primase
MINLEQLAIELGLKRVKIRGEEIHASCPFPENHLSGSDRHPSFAINVEKGVFNCFSCGSKGTIEELVATVRGLSITGALSFLEGIGFSKLERELRERQEDVLPEIIPEGILLYYDKMENEFAEIYRGEVDGQECLIYPVRNIEGKLVGALARSIEGKYHKVLWNLQKSRFLYGENLIEIEQPVVIVEGPGDVISLRKSGLKNAVALMGISVSDTQAEKLLALSSEFVVWLDKDESGAKGMLMIHKKLENRATIRYVNPWEYSEIESKGDAKQVYECCGEEAVKTIIEAAETYLEQIVKEQCNDRS